jgi:hypothetical protein
MKRVVMPEWLDEMGAEEAAAMRSRRDIRRLNSLLWHAHWMAVPPLAESRRSAVPSRIVDIGAGDGTFMWKLAGRISASAAKRPRLEEGMPLQNPEGHIVLVDQRRSVSPMLGRLYETAGWTVEVVQSDVFDWLPGAEPADAIVANLFLHHFEAGPLARLLALAANKCGLFVACEPRRCAPALAASRLLWLIGCNAVTRHDAVTSVHAGFRGRELSSLWTAEGWTLREERAGLFSHLFVARKNGVLG